MNLALLILVGTALITRVIIYSQPNLIPDFPDAQAYTSFALDILALEFPENHIYTFLYPIWKALFINFDLAWLADICVSVFSALILFNMLVKLNFDNIVKYLAVFVYLFHPWNIFYSVSGLSEVLLGPLYLIFFYCLISKYYGRMMIVVSLIVLLKPVHFYFACAAISIWIIKSWVSHRSYLLQLKILGIPLLVFSPWLAFQEARYDQWVTLPLASGIVLYTGNNPKQSTGGGITGVDVRWDDLKQINNPVEYDRYLTEKALDYIEDDPVRFLANGAVKLKRFLGLEINNKEISNQFIDFLVLSSALTGLLFIILGFRGFGEKFGICGIVLVFGFFAYLIAVHFVTFGSIRYRYPIELIVSIVYAPFCIDFLRRKFS